MIPRLLLLVVLLCTSVSPAAALSLGVTVANGLVRSESQVQAFAAYLESCLGEPVTWRVFANDRTLHDWLNRFREIDLAVLDADYLQEQLPGEFSRLGRGVRPDGTTTAVVVMRQGSSPQRVEQARQALLQMEQTPDGRALLGTLGLQRFDPAPRMLPLRVAPRAAQKPLAAVPPPRAPVVRKAAPAPATIRRAPPASIPARTADRRAPVAVVATQPPPAAAPLLLPARPAEPATLSLGLLPGNSLVRTEAEAGRLVGYLAAGLGRPVSARVFADQGALHDWLAAQPGSELAVLAAAPAGAPALTRLARIVRPGGRLQEALVIRADADPQLKQRLQELLLGMSDHPEGLKVLGEVGLEGFAAEFPAPVAAAPTPLPAPSIAAPIPPAPPVPALAPKVPPPLPTLPREGVQAERRGRWDDAIRIYQRTLTADSRQVELWLRIADIQAMLGRSHDAALSMLWMLDVMADDAALYHRLGQAHAVNGQFRAALAAAGRAVALAPTNDDYLRSRAQLAAWVGDTGTVRESYLQILTRGWVD